MKFSRAEIPDIVIIEPEIYKDDRGYFFESFRQDKLNEYLGYDVNFCQENESKSTFGVLRGLHYQESPFAQAKLVRIIQGSVLDVAVDIRKDSPTFGSYLTIELNEDNKKELFIPRGFAHGFISLSEKTIFHYKVDNYYNSNLEKGIHPFSQILNINWKIKKSEIKISLKDKSLPLFSERMVSKSF